MDQERVGVTGPDRFAAVPLVPVLAPGTALDVGSGEGADVIWLATQGWNATGADISPIALRRAAELAAQAGPAVTARIAWQQADLLSWQPPEGHFDLISAQFIHLPRPERESLHRRLAAGPAGRSIETAEPGRQATFPGGETYTIHDAVLRAVRRS
jgi:SAM-dependent methyltransferase